MRPLNRTVIIVSDMPEDDSIIPRFRPAPKWPPRAVGLAVTLLVHLLLGAPLLLGTAAHKIQRRTPDGPGSVEFAAQGEHEESMVLIDLSALSASSQKDESQPEIKSEGIQPEKFKLELASLEPKPPPDLEFDDASISEEANPQAGDPAGNAALFGRYMGQVSARIDRAWLRPRSEVADGQFSCRARIVQDRQGVVLSIALSDCNGDEAWKKSLISAIQRASPLSAPPEPWLFTETITLGFTADQYAEGRTPEYQYQPMPRQLAMNQPIEKPLPDTADSVSNYQSLTSGAGDVDLTISGGQIRWTKKKPSAATSE